jgi:hypothetical protein
MRRSDGMRGGYAVNKRIWSAVPEAGPDGAEALPEGEGQYTFHFTGDMRGTAVVRRDGTGKVVVSAYIRGMGSYSLCHDVCPFIPVWAGSVKVKANFARAIIEGNTSTSVHASGKWARITLEGNTISYTRADGYWSRTMVEGNTTTYTYSPGTWKKTVTEGNTMTTTRSDGSWEKTVTEGNTMTTTRSDGSWETTVTEGNTMTETHSDGDWVKTVVDGDTTAVMFSWGQKTLVKKRGCDVFVYREHGRRRRRMNGPMRDDIVSSEKGEAPREEGMRDGR